MFSVPLLHMHPWMFIKSHFPFIILVNLPYLIYLFFLFSFSFLFSFLALSVISKPLPINAPHHSHHTHKTLCTDCPTTSPLYVVPVCQFFVLFLMLTHQCLYSMSVFPWCAERVMSPRVCCHVVYHLVSLVIFCRAEQKKLLTFVNSIFSQILFSAGHRTPRSTRSWKNWMKRSNANTFFFLIMKYNFIMFVWLIW